MSMPKLTLESMKAECERLLTSDSSPKPYFVTEHPAFLLKLISDRADLLEACEQTTGQGQHADGCGWWNHAALDLETEQGRAAADADCNCFLRECYAAIAKTKGGE